MLRAVISSLLLVTVPTPGFAQTIPPAPVPPAKALEAAMALQRGDLDQAVLAYNAALDDTSISNDRRAVLLTERGVASMKRRNFKDALDDFNKAASLYPENAAIYVNRGSLLLLLGQAPDQTREAIRDFGRALVLSPSLAAAFGNRGAAHLKLGAHDQAIADFTRAIELQPQNPAALNGRGRARLLAGRTHAAIRDFTRAVTLNPGFAQSYRNRAEAYSRFRQYTEAAEDLSRALAFDARRVDDYIARGRAYLAADNAAAALNDFTKVVELDPNAVDGYIGMGFAKARADATEDALNDLSRAVELDPRSASAYAVRAWIYKKRLQPDLGERDVERALRLEPVKADAFWAQGELNEAAGDKDAAVAAYSRALGLDIHHADALAALSRLGYEPQQPETPLPSAGLEGWRVSAAADQFIATNPNYVALRVPLEMLGTGQPRIVAFERMKAPNAGFGILQFTSGSLPNASGPDLAESAAILDLSANTVIAMPVAKLGTRTATYGWTENKLTISGADGLVEAIILRGKSEPKDGRDKEKEREVAAATPRSRPEQGGQAAGQRQTSSSGGAPAWSPWAQQGNATRDHARATPPLKKSKSLFELIFGN